jgi:hypothetical protein
MTGGRHPAVSSHGLSLCAFTLCVLSVCPDLLSLLEHQSECMRATLSDLPSPLVTLSPNLVIF